MPTITIKEALTYMNKLDTNGKPIPFTVWAVSKAKRGNKDYGRVIKLKNAIMARNAKYLDGNLAFDDVELPNVENNDWIFATDWKFYLPDTEEIKSLISHRITHIDYMEVL